MSNWNSLKGYKKHFRGALGRTTKGTEISLGSHGLVALRSGELKDSCVQSIMDSLRKRIKDKGKIFLRVEPNHSMTKKPLNMKMGGGKGKFDHYSCFVRSGKVIVEIDGLDEATSLDSLRIAASKSPIKLGILKRRT